MLRDKLENEIEKHIHQTHKEASLIVMNPQTFQHLCEENWLVDNIKIIQIERFLDTTGILKYRGIRVLRSLDVIEGMFEVR